MKRYGRNNKSRCKLHGSECGVVDDRKKDLKGKARRENKNYDDNEFIYRINEEDIGE